MAARFAPFVRLEVAEGMPEALAALLTEELKLDSAQNVLRVQGLLDLAHLSSLPARRHPPAPAPPHPTCHRPVSSCHAMPCHQCSIEAPKTDIAGGGEGADRKAPGPAAWTPLAARASVTAGDAMRLHPICGPSGSLSLTADQTSVWRPALLPSKCCSVACYPGIFHVVIAAAVLPWQ